MAESTTRAERTGPAQPRLTAVRLGALVPADPADVADGDADLDDTEVRDLRTDTLVWSGRRRLGSSRVAQLAAAEWIAPGASIVGSVLEEVSVVALGGRESSWRNVEISQSRIGSAELYDSMWRNVRFSHCKLGYLNLRGAKLTDVVFADCVIDELDLGRATVNRVALPGTRIGRLEPAGATLTDVDLRGATLADIGDLAGLRGATVTIDQLLDLAPMLAARIGIRVE
nr:pentapeptide repeat-containing protein [Propionicimonas sp.]